MKVSTGSIRFDSNLILRKTKGSAIDLTVCQAKTPTAKKREQLRVSSGPQLQAGTVVFHPPSVRAGGSPKPKYTYSPALTLQCILHLPLPSSPTCLYPPALHSQTSVGKFPLAVSPDSITKSVPSRTALATSLTSAHPRERKKNTAPICTSVVVSWHACMHVRLSVRMHA